MSSAAAASSINGWCLTSPARAQLKNTARPCVIASATNSSTPVPPSLIRNQPVYAAPSPIITPTLDEDQVQELVKKIQESMDNKAREGDDYVQELVMIDAIQRLGLEYYFQDYINSTIRISSKMDGLFSDDDDDDDDNLHDVALRFRLLRHAGFNVQAETSFSKFKNKDGKFRKELEEDTKGLLSLFEASQLSIPGDDILDEAADFTLNHLNKIIKLKSVENSEIDVIRNTLRDPYHKSLPKLTAKNQLHNFDALLKFMHHDCYDSTQQWIQPMQDLATLDIKMAQITFKHEKTQVSTWWKNVGIAEVLDRARNQPVKWHMWASVAVPNPEKGEIRIELTKMISFIYIIDDIFDVYGTVDELTLFTTAVNNNWEYSTIEDSILPDYMKLCLKALFHTIDLISHFVFIKHGWNPKFGLQKAWGELCNAFLVEGKWFKEKHLPSTEEYLKNGIVSSGFYVVFATLFSLLGEAKDMSNGTHLLNTYPDIVTLAGTLLRLWDDLGSAKDENQEGHDGSFVECYKKENQGSSDKMAREHVISMISNVWKRLNENCLLSHSPFSADFKNAFLNLSRMIPIMYKYDHNHRLQSLEKHMKSLLNCG